MSIVSADWIQSQVTHCLKLTKICKIINLSIKNEPYWPILSRRTLKRTPVIKIVYVYPAVLSCNFIQVLFSLQFGAEFRRFSLDRCEPGRYKDFHRLIVRLHHLWQMDVLIGYADVQGELLPINNDDNFCKAVTSGSTQSLLRIFIQLQGTGRVEAEYLYSFILCSIHLTLQQKFHNNVCNIGHYFPNT